jgi:glycosyltransferase involved in cell wall biosynthesis
MRQVVVNARVLTAPVAGVQRYTTQILARWNGHADRIAPGSPLHGLVGHAWEQFVLPAQAGGRLLFSPSNSGPLGAKNQVVTIHDMSVFDSPESFSPRFGAWYRFLLPRLARRVRRVITDSGFIKERILDHTKVSPDKVVVIHCGVDSRFCPGAATRLEEAAVSLRLPSRSFILAVGSLEPRKNLVRLFQAWSRIEHRIPEEIWLVVAGARGNSRVFSGGQFGALPARVFLAGHVREDLLPSLYAGAVATVYPSMYEGFGLPALEAMASGSPVLAGKRSSLPEVVGDAGLLVDPHDVEAIAEGICRIVGDSALRDELRGKGLLRARQFSWDEAARKTWEVLQNAAAEGLE